MPVSSFPKITKNQHALKHLMSSLTSGETWWNPEPFDLTGGTPVAQDPYPIFNGVTAKLAQPSKKAHFPPDAFKITATLTDVVEHKLGGKAACQVQIVVDAMIRRL